MFSGIKPVEESSPALIEQSSLLARASRTINRAARTLLPDGILQEVRNWRGYEPAERPIYLKVRVLNRIGLGRKLGIPKHARSFLFVCSGNIIRSPMCEALVKRELAASPQYMVASAGLNATPGRAAHPWAIAAAQEFGISLRQHRARLLTSEMVDHADMIFAMDHQNQVQLLSRYPGAKHKVHLLGTDLTGGTRPIEIRDPYYAGKPQTLGCYRILSASICSLVSRIQRDLQVEQLGEPYGGASGGGAASA